jgi:tetratricopeptide (TPR) repeat protein
VLISGVVSVREKQKGNEAFRAGENDEAYAFYSRSLALDSDSAVVYTNRAVLAIRMEKLETAVDDASRAILIDPTYMKAYYRRGVARLKLGQTGEVSHHHINDIALWNFG